MNYKKQILLFVCFYALTATNQLHGMLRLFYSDDAFKDQTPEQLVIAPVHTMTCLPGGIDQNKWDLLMNYLHITNGKELVIVNAQLTTDQFKQVIEFLPEQILNAIIFVRLFGNQLTTLPAEIIKFKNVKVICADGNPLITLPEEVTCLEQLEELTINHTVALPAGLRSNIHVVRR